RSVFSAANEFVKYVKCCQQVVVVGDRTGGGAGLPFTSELPCGWSVRFSACPMYDRNRQSTEFGIAPDHPVALSAEDQAKDLDTLIEYARKMI
ncbi:MAG: peptidase S41, partial [Muribaculaceae bacterium]|nr:peptidase S41 [Muribaculaceae bacterium]